MWSICAKPIQRSSHSTIFTILKSNPRLLLQHLQKRKALPHPPSPRQGLTQKERDLLEYLKDDPTMRQVVLQKIMDKKGNSNDDETVSSAASSSPKPGDPCLQDSQDPYEL